MYTLILGEEINENVYEVLEITKVPTVKQQEKGVVVESLTAPEQFINIDEKLYYIKKENE